MKKLIRFSLFLALTAFLAVGVISGTALTAHASSGSDSCGAGISLSDTVSNHTPSVNDTITYTVSGSISLSDPTEISVKDILGDGSGDELTFVSATSSVGHYSSSTGIWDLGTLNNGQSVSLSIVATVDPGAAGKTIDNQPTYTESCCSTSQSILGVSIHVKPAIGTLSVSVHGLLNGATSTVALSDGTANAFSSSTVTGDTISPLSFSLDQGDSYSVTATTTAPGYTVATSTGCTDSSFSSGTDCVITFSSSEADLSLTKATLGGISTTTPSSTVTYVLTVKALGPATSTDVTVTDPLPAGIAYVSSAPSEGTTTFTAATGTPGTLVWTVGDMASGTVATTSVVTTVDANASGVITNTASVTESTSSTNLDPNTATSTITVEPNTPNTATIFATKIVCPAVSELPDLSYSGATITSSTARAFLATHPDCQAAADWDFQWGNASVSDPDTASSSFIGPEASSTGWNTFGPTDASGTVSVTIPNPTSTSRIWVREVLQGGYLGFSYPGTNSTDSAEMFCNTDVKNYDNYDYVASPAVGGTYYCAAWNVKSGSPASSEADLAITKVADVTTTTPSTSGATSTVTYLLTVKALGPATSTDVVATDTLPTDLAFISATPSEGTTSYASSTGSLTWTIGDMASGTVATTSVVTTVNANASGTITNTATIGESASSTNMDPNTATSTITVEPAGCTGSSCGGHSTGDLNITVSGLPSGATSTVTVSQSSATIATLSMGNGATSTVLTVGDPYSVTATTTAPGYTVANLNGLHGQQFLVGNGLCDTCSLRPKLIFL